MSISGIPSISGSHAASSVQGGLKSTMPQNLDAVAAQLGMSVSDLKAQLQSGKSLANIIANHKSGHHAHSDGAQGVSGAQAGKSASGTSGVDKDGDNDGS